MALGNVNNNNNAAEIQKLMGQNVVYQSEVQGDAQLNSVFQSCNVEKETDGSEEKLKGNNEIPPWRSALQGILAKITGQTQQSNPVDDITNQPASDGKQAQFDENGNLLSDVTSNEDGSKDIKTSDGEIVHITSNNGEISVKNENGEIVSCKTTGDNIEFTDENGKKYTIPKDMLS